MLLRYETGDRVKALRKANNMPVKDLAKQMNIRASSLRMIEFGGRDMTVYNYLKLHEIFNVSIHCIITGKEFESLNLTEIKHGSTLENAESENEA